MVCKPAEGANPLFRKWPPVACRVIELPAGLCGDLTDQPDEALEVAAQQELLEETGYRAKALQELSTVASSAGMTNEVVTIFIADEIEKVESGGGDESEGITVHEIPLVEVHDWLDREQKAGKLVDARVYGGLYFLQRESVTDFVVSCHRTDFEPPGSNRGTTDTTSLAMVPDGTSTTFLVGERARRDLRGTGKHGAGVLSNVAGQAVRQFRERITCRFACVCARCGYRNR